MTEGLLPCWQCNAKNAQLCTMKKKYYVACSNCLTISPLFTSSLAAAKSWNDTYLEHMRTHKEEHNYDHASKQR